MIYIVKIKEDIIFIIKKEKEKKRTEQTKRLFS
jgi:hypothetical protein